METEQKWSAVPEEQIFSVIREFYKNNEGDESTTDLILAIGAELLNLSKDQLLEEL